MSVAVSIPPSLQTLVDGVVEADVVGSTVGDCLHELVRLLPPLKKKIFTRSGRLPQGMTIFINGKAAVSPPLSQPVRGGDKVQIAYVVLGG
jgi:molybdopterin converting factor small subunit